MGDNYKTKMVPYGGIKDCYTVRYITSEGEEINYIEMSRRRKKESLDELLNSINNSPIIPPERIFEGKGDIKMHDCFP
ncbi:hypothetical protein J4411_02345 [Candidatus Pacearchaeota archaeon]|nr:hypothetical protein [Candidatus Pacearchaeota archaeon]